MGDVAPLRGGFAFKSEEYRNSGIPIIRISNIMSDGTVGSDFVYYSEKTNDSDISLQDGAVVLAMSGATTGKVAILHCKSSEKFYQNQRVGYFTRNKGSNYNYVSIIVRSKHFTTQLSSVLVAGAQPNVSSKDIDNFVFMFPQEIVEQELIGTLFSTLDKLIALRQRKLELLRQLKKAMLQQMFPDKDSNIPQLRFNGFNDTWKQRKLGELFTLSNERNKGGEFSQGQTLSVATMQLKPEGNGESQENTVLAKVLRVGDLLFEGHTNRKHPFGRIIVNTAQDGIVSPRFRTFRPKTLVNPMFWKYFFIGSQQTYTLLLRSTKSGVMMNEMVNEDFFSEQISIPFRNEQTKIASLLSTLDQLITLHTSDLARFERLKKFLLQTMFV